MNKEIENKNEENELSIDYPESEEEWNEANQGMNIVRKEDGSEDFRMIAKFNLSEKAIIEEISENGDYSNFENNPQYSEQDVKEFIRRLKEEAKDHRTISAAREEDCILLETLNSIIDKLSGFDEIKMTELKTLKDLRNPEFVQYKDCNSEVLRAEAIKWIKGMENARYGDGENFKERLKGFEDFYDDEYDSFSEVINWIKHFFNITDEDLK